MRAICVPLWMLAMLFITLPIAQAKTNYAYVANNSANTVSVIDTANNTIVKTITVGTGPWYVAVNQAGSVAYVTNESSNNVSVISTTTNTVVATIPVGSQPNGVAFAPNGKTAYVTNDGSGSVSVINTGTKKVTATVTVGTRPVGVAVTPNGAFVYVANLTSGTVSVISTLTNKVVATVSVGSGPTYLAVSPNGTTVYVPNFGSNSVSVIRTADNTVINTISVPEGVWGAAVSPDGGLVYVTDYVYGPGDLVTVIDTATQQVTGTTVVGQAPLGTTFTQDSAFAYVANSTSGNVSVINTASGTVVDTIGVGTNPIGAAVMGTMKVSTVVGGYVGDKGSLESAAFNAPYSSVYDKAGNLYISDFLMNRIRRVTPSSTITTYAGTGICGYNGENIKSTEATLCYPNGLALDAAGDLIVAGGDSRIRKITPKGTITTIVGTGVYGNNGNGGPALNAEIGQPYGITYDAAGNLYFADVGNCVVREVDTSGTITTIAGNGTCSYNGNGSPATSYELNLPRGIAVDGSGNVYIGDSKNNLVREVTPAGVISNFVEVNSPRYLFLQNGALYISTDSQMQSVNLTTNKISTYAGSYFGYDGDGNPLLATEFTNPSMIFDSGGDPVFDDPLNGRVRAATGGIVNTIAGGYLGDGDKATSAALVFPEALAIDKSNNFYIADFTGNRVREVSGKTIKTIAGTGISGYTGDHGSATVATLYAPQGVAADSNGNVFIADTYNGVIREVSGGMISTFATNANFNYLLQMATDTANNLYVADNGACVVWKITPAPAAAVSIAAGVLNTCGYNSDGIPATTAELNGPYSVALDSSGDLFIADNGNNRIREVNTSGIISTVTGNNTCADTGDGGPATSAEICGPYGVAVAKSGTIYLSDANNRVRQISGGTITTYAGSGGIGFNGDGLWPLLTAFDEPIAIALDSKGNLYVLDDAEHRVREID